MGKYFGTDGVRGIANEHPMTPQFVVSLGRAGATLLKEKEKEAKIIIGKDTRISCGMLEAALIAGITSTGVDCVQVGVIPTPAVAFLTQELGATAGIVISASHNPVEDNGIKFFGPNGYKLPDEVEDRIEGLLNTAEKDFEHPTGIKIGAVLDAVDAEEKYFEFLKSTFPASLDLKGLKIVVDCANGATYKVAPSLMRNLGAEVVEVNCRPDGTNINLNCGSLHPEVLVEKVLSEKADIGLSFDGDGDRLISVDEKGNIVDGDFVMAICGKFLKEKGELDNNLVVSTVMSNLGLDIALKEIGIEGAKTKVGDRYVLEEMQKRSAVIGGEDSGHIIFLKHHTTGDGILTSLQVLRVMKEKNVSLSELASVMKKFPQLTINVDVKEKPELSTLPEVQEAIKLAENKLAGQGRVLVRYSGTQPMCRVMVEGPTQEEIIELAESIAQTIREKLG